MCRLIPIPMNRDAPSTSLFLGAMNVMFPIADKVDQLQSISNSHQNSGQVSFPNAKPKKHMYY